MTMDDLREQFIERLTREIFAKRGEGFVLKGGGAMRALFGNQRLTKDVDLDFTNPRRTADSLHKTVRHAIETAARGLPVRELTISEPGKRETTPKWKVNFTGPEGRSWHVEVEVSRNPERAVPGIVEQAPYVPAAAKGIARFWVDIYSRPALIATKLAALLGREAARDVYDLDLLKDTGAAPDAETLAWAVHRSRIEGEDPVEVLWAHLDALDWDRFANELSDALPTEAAARVDSTEWTAMKLRVGEYAERLLREAASTRP